MAIKSFSVIIAKKGFLMKNNYFLSIVTATLLFPLHASTLHDTVKQTLLTNSEILSNTLNLESQKEDITKEEANYYPTLDMDAYLQKSKTQDNKATGDTQNKIDGHKITLKAEQLLYDGGKTPSKINEQKYKYASSTFNTNKKNEDIVFDIVKAYLDLVKFSELNQLADYSVTEHQKALDIAHEKEQISGETMETQRTLSMIYSENDKKFIQEEEYKKALAKYQKISSINDAKDICRPVINDVFILQSLENIIEIALQNSYKIKEQKEVIEKQKSKVSEEKSNYEPVVKLKAFTSYDKDIALVGQGDQKEVNGQLSLNWNFYSGGKDQAGIEKERIKLREEQKTLETIEKEVIEDVTNLFNKYMQTKDRIENLKKSLAIELEMLKLNNAQLADGTKTFIDSLQAKNKVIDAQSNLLKQEFTSLNSYYELLKELSLLSKTIMDEKDQICQDNIVIVNLIADKKEEIQSLDALLDEKNIEKPILIENNTTKQPEIKTEENLIIPTIIPTINPTISSHDMLTLNSEIKNLLKDFSGVNIDETTLKITMLINSNSFTLDGLNSNDKFKNDLDTFLPQLLRIIGNNKEGIQSIKIKSYTSSEHRKFKEPYEAFQANKELSQRRANKVKQYFIDSAIKANLDFNWFTVNSIPEGMGSLEIVKTPIGAEDKDASRRITIEIVKR